MAACYGRGCSSVAGTGQRRVKAAAYRSNGTSFPYSETRAKSHDRPIHQLSRGGIRMSAADMTIRTPDGSRRFKARMAGFFFLILILTAVAGLCWLPFAPPPLASYLSPYNLASALLLQALVMLWLLVMGVKIPTQPREQGFAN